MKIEVGSKMGDKWLILEDLRFEFNQHQKFKITKKVID